MSLLGFLALLWGIYKLLYWLGISPGQWAASRANREPPNDEEDREPPSL